MEDETITDEQVIAAIDAAEAAFNNALLLAARKGVLTRLETGTAELQGVSRNYVKTVAWRKTDLR